MDDATPAQRHDHPHPATPTASEGSSAVATRRRGWLIPLLTLLLGMALGAGLMGLLGGDAEGPQEVADDTPTPSATQPAPAPTPSGGQIVVPASCVEIADESGRLNGILVDGVAAARDLDAMSMSAIVRDFGSVQTRLQQLSEECRAGVGASGVTTTTPSPAPTTTTDAS